MSSASRDVFLNCPFSDKDEVKARGARWDREQRRWYVPAGMNLTPFAPWLPEAERAALDLTGTDAPSADDSLALFGGTAVTLPPVGEPDTRERFGPVPDNAPQYTVREFVTGVRKVVLSAFDHDVWIVGQITSVKERRTMHVIEIMDSDQAGAMGAARLEIKAFQGPFAAMLRKLRDVAGQDLAPGMMVRIKVRPEFDVRYHLGARLLDIDPTVTVGAFELKLRQIRQALAAEGVLGRNRALPAPVDFCAIAVIHPVGASGFEDFRRDADRLVARGLCRIHYIPATFEGMNAERSLLDAFDQARMLHETSALDALVVIRGGGSKHGLMALSTEKLAHAVCLFPVPVLTGLGHADDDTLLDELAWRRCDTPSKTIAYIRDAILGKARAGAEAFRSIAAIAQAQLAQHDHHAKTLATRITHAATLAVRRQREEILSAGTAVQHAATSARTRLAQARQAIGIAHAEIVGRAPAALAAARARADALAQSLAAAASAGLAAARSRLDQERHGLLHNARRGLERGGEMLDRMVENIRTKATDLLDGWRREAEHAATLIQALGPDATLARGFALVLDAKGKAVTTAKAIRRRTKITLRLKDGTVSVAPIKGE